MKPSRVLLRRLLDAPRAAWNSDACAPPQPTTSIEITLPIGPDDLQTKPDDYVMYAAYYVRQNCPSNLSPNDVKFEVVRRIEYRDHLCSASIENKAIGKHGITASIRKDSGAEELSARRMMFEQLEQMYTKWRSAVLQAAIDRKKI